MDLSFHKAFLNLYALISYIVNYEELLLSSLEVTLSRSGGIRKESSPVTNSNQTDSDYKFDIVKDVNEKEKAIKDVINTLLAEYDNTIVSHQTSANQIIIVDESNRLHTKSVEKIEDIKLIWDALEQLFPSLMTIKFKTDLINDIKQIYNECSLLEPMSRSIIELTQYDDNNDEKNNGLNIIASSKKTRQTSLSKKNKIKFTHEKNL